MHDEWEQFPPIEGNEGPGSGVAIVFLFVGVCLAIGFVAGALIF